MKKLIPALLALAVLGQLSCDDELVAAFPECHINRTGALKVKNNFNEDYVLYIDTHYYRQMNPGDSLFLIVPERSNVFVWFEEAEYDSVPHMIKDHLFIEKCDTLLFAPG
jgi:hypothetical protein